MSKGNNTAKILPLEASEKRVKESNKKWGASVMKIGFNIIPSILIRGQSRLGLSSPQIMVLLQIIDHWWNHRDWPFPSKRELSNRIGIGQRQIGRHLEALEKAGLIKRIERFGGHHGRKSNEYDLSGLVEKIQALEPEFRQAKEAKEAVTKKGGLKVHG